MAANLDDRRHTAHAAFHNSLPAWASWAILDADTTERVIAVSGSFGGVYAVPRI